MQNLSKWNSMAADYQKVFQSGMNDYNRGLLSFLVDEGLLRPGCRVLDVGCGVGKYGTYFAAMGCDVTLSDISPGMLEMAKKNMSGFSTPWTVLECDFETVPESHPAFEKGFELGFSTMCPAIHDLATVKKISAMVDGWCFVAHFIKWEEPQRQRFYDKLGLEAEDMNRFSAQMDKLSQAVVDAGYRPHIRCVPYNWCDEREPEAAADYLLLRTGLQDVPGELRAKAIITAKELSNSDGIFVDQVNTSVAWLYWNTKEGRK